MILGNKPPEELSLETLVSVAVVLTGIKKASESNTTSDNLKTFPLEFKFKKVAGIPISRYTLREAEKSKAEIVKYLMSQGALEAFVQEPLLGNSHTRPDFLVTIKPKTFNQFYERALRLTLPHIEAVIEYQSQTGTSNHKLVHAATSTRSENIEVKLEFNEFSEPVLTTSYGSHTLPSLKEGRVYDVLLTYRELYFGQVVSLDQMKKDLVKLGRMHKGLNNFKQAFRRTSFDVDEGALRNFVFLKPKHMVIKGTATLSQQEWQAIVELAESKQKSRQT